MWQQLKAGYILYVSHTQKLSSNIDHLIGLCGIQYLIDDILSNGTMLLIKHLSYQIRVRPRSNIHDV